MDESRAGVFALNFNESRSLFFALLERHGNSSLYPLCAGTRPVSPVHLAWRVERRGNQHCPRSSMAKTDFMEAVSSLPKSR